MTDLFELNLSQTDIYFDQLKRPSNPVYNIGGYIRLKAVDIARIQKAHRDLVHSDPLFGLRIVTTEDGVRQCYVDARDDSLPLVDFSAEAEGQQKAKAWLNDLFSIAFRFDDKPLYNAHLVKLSDNAYWYVAKAHHMLVDGWGFSKWAQLISFYYNQSLSSEQWLEFNQGLWQQVAAQDSEYVGSAKFDKDKAYWLNEHEMVGGLFLAPLYQQHYDDPMNLPSNRLVCPIDPNRAAQVFSLGQQLGVGNSQIYQAALSCYLASAYDVDKLVYGMPFHNRKNHQQKQMLGVFTSVSPLALSLPKDIRFAEVASAIAKAQKRNFRHQRYPIGRIINDYKPLTGQDELFDVSFNFLKLEVTLDFDGVPADLVYVSNHYEKEPLKVTVWEYGQQEHTEVHFDHNYGYFNDEQIAFLAQKYLAILDKVLAEPQLMLGQLNVLSEAEKATLVEQQRQYMTAQAEKASNQAQKERPFSATERALQGIWQAQLFGETQQSAIVDNASILEQDAEYQQWLKYTGSTKAKQMSRFWQTQLSGASGDFALMSRIGQNHQRHSAQHHQTLDKALIAQLKQQASEHGLEVTEALLGVFALLLGKYSNHQQLLVGLMAEVTTPMPVRIDLDEGSSFDTLLAGLKGTLDNAKQHWPMTEAHLCQLGDVKQGLLTTVIGDKALAAELTEQPLLQLIFDGEQCTLDWHYQAGVLSGAFIAQLQQSFVLLLSQAVQTRGILGDFTLIEQSAFATLLAEQQGPQVEVDSHLLIGELFEQRAKLSPQQIALVFEGQRLSYGALAEQVNRQSRWLLEQGVCIGELVGVYMERSIDMVVSLLAIMKSGGAYVPLDPDHPVERAFEVIAEAGIKRVLSQSHLIERFDDVDGSLVVAIDAPAKAGAIAQMSAEDFARPQGLDSGSLCYVIYTSGSTGKPKGVMVAHQSVINRLQWMANCHQLEAGEKVLQKTPYGFDVSVWEFFWTLGYGGTLVLAKAGGHKDPLYLSELIAAEQINVVHFVPSMLNAFLSVDEAYLSTSVKSVFCSGEALLKSDVSRLYAAKPDVAVYNLYGPTEASIEVSYFDCAKAEDYASVPIGKPIQNVALYVLDSKRRLLPKGAPGQLFIGGGCLAKGYYQAPVLSEKAFIEHRWPDGRLERLYQSGDLVRRLEDDNIEYMGRIDHQVKLRGLRIELGEIESRLQQLDVVDSAVVLVAGEGQRAQLVAFVKVNTPQNTTALEQSMQRHLSKVLPGYMVPEHFEQVSHWPQNHNGKIDRKQLLAGLNLRAKGNIGLTDNFFKLGGNSLQSIKQLNQINRQFNVRLLLEDIFSSKDLAALAAKIDSAEKQQSLMAKADIHQSAPLSPAQQRLWLIDQLGQGSNQYNMPVAYRVEGAFDVAVAQAALNDVIAQHRILSTTYAEHQGQGVQQIQFDRQCVISCEDISALNEQDKALAATEFVRAAAEYDFDLSQDLMLQACWLKTAQTSGILSLCVHHIAADGWSVGLVINDFKQAYQSRIKGQAPDFASVRQYIDYAHFSRSENAQTSQSLAYWQQQLADAPVKHSLPLDFPRPMQQSFSGCVFEQALSPELNIGLAQLAQQHQTTPFVVLHGLFSLLLGRHSGQQDILIGTAVANRLHPEVESMVGFFVNTLVLRTELGPQLSFSDYLKQVAKVNRQAQSHQSMPFEQLVDSLEVVRTRAHNPLFQVMLTMDNSAVDAFALEHCELTPMAQQTVKAKFDIELIVRQNANGELLCRWVYDTALFSAKTIETLHRHLCRLTQSAYDNSDENIHCLAMLDDTELHHQVVTLNQATLDYPKTQRLNRLFSLQAEQSPQAIALECGEDKRSFGTLERQSNQMAHYLIANGVMPGDLVGVSLNRHCDMVVAILAIHKAGAAYVPLDPAYPDERLSQIIELCQLPFMLIEPQNRTRVTGFASKTQLLNCGVYEAQYSTDTPALSGLDAEQPAYVIFTSGSTGVPKGVVIRHRNAVSMLYWAKAFYHASELERVLASTSLNFDLSVFELFVPLCFGHTCVLADNALSLLEGDWRLSLINTVPSAAKVLLGANAVPRGVQVVNLAGEPLPQSTVNALLGTTDAKRVCNLYGPSEDTTYSTYAEFSRALDEAPHIGKVLPNSQAYVLSAQRQVVPYGAVGELYLGGAGVSAGYYGQPELTEERYIANPWCQEGGVLYRTGDLVRYRLDGNFDYLGRADEQLKIRGFRVEPGEIANQLLALELVADVQVLASVDLSEQLCLVAYVITKAGVSQSHNEIVQSIKAELASRLPEYMIPAVFVLLDEWPLTNNGKINKRALPQPDWLQTAEFVAAATATEHQVVAIIQGLFNWQDRAISVSANFFELGLNSLSALNLIKKINEALNISLKPDAVFEHSTIQALCAHLDLYYLMPTLLVEDDDEFETDGEI